MTLAVIEPLQSDGVDVGDNNRASRPSAAVEFAVKVGQAGRSGASSSQRVHLGDRQCASERLAICERLQAVTRALLAVCRRGLAVPGGLCAVLSGPGAVAPGARALLGCPDDDPRFGDSARVVVLVIGVTLGHRQVARGGSPISRQRRQIAGLCGRVALDARSQGVLRPSALARATCAGGSHGWHRAPEDRRHGRGHDRWRPDHGRKQPGRCPRSSGLAHRSCDQCQPASDHCQPASARRRPASARCQSEAARHRTPAKPGCCCQAVA